MKRRDLQTRPTKLSLIFGPVLTIEGATFSTIDGDPSLSITGWLDSRFRGDKRRTTNKLQDGLALISDAAHRSLAKSYCSCYPTHESRPVLANTGGSGPLSPRVETMTYR